MPQKSFFTDFQLHVGLPWLLNSGVTIRLLANDLWSCQNRYSHYKTSHLIRRYSSVKCRRGYKMWFWTRAKKYINGWRLILYTFSCATHLGRLFLNLKSGVIWVRLWVRNPRLFTFTKLQGVVKLRVFSRNLFWILLLMKGCPWFPNHVETHAEGATLPLLLAFGASTFINVNHDLASSAMSQWSVIIAYNCCLNRW